MPRSFNLRAISLPSASSFKEPAVLVRGALGLLLLANVVAALFAFHVFGTSPAELDASVVAARSRLAADQLRLARSRSTTGSLPAGFRISCGAARPTKSCIAWPGKTSCAIPPSCGHRSSG